MAKQTARNIYKFVALILTLLLSVGPVSAGITISGADGITLSGADGVTYLNTYGIYLPGADVPLSLGVNGITSPDGITLSGADGITLSGADGATYTGPNGITLSGADGITLSGADGLLATGPNGITLSGADGTSYPAIAVLIRQPDGITLSGADLVNVVNADGITPSGADGITLSGADGITLSGADGITLSGADGVTLIGPNGNTVIVGPSGITISGADKVRINRPIGVNAWGADSIVQTGLDSIQTVIGPLGLRQRGLQSVDPELAVKLNRLTDDSNVNAIVVYHNRLTSTDLADLQRLGVLGGTVYTALPMVALTTTKARLLAISHLPAVRSIYGNRTLNSNMDSRLAINGVDRMQQDTDLTSKIGGLKVAGQGVTVAVLDTGVDGTQADLAGRVVQNVKLVDTQSVNLGFRPPTVVENLSNTDQAYGHGTFVAGVIAGNGSHSNGKYSGVAPSARVVGLSAGDLTLAFVLSGFDYLLTHGEGLNVRVVNCSFSANTVFDVNDPVNIATKMLTDSGINVVFSAGNTGPGLHSLNPYAVAPWVVSVGATDERGHLADWSSRGDFGSMLFRPTLVAPGVNIVSVRATGVNVTGISGLTGSDTSMLTAAELPYYTTASGTSFSAPQVAGTIALMLEMNPNLTTAQVRDILRRTATPLPPYFQHEVGAGMLNAYAAVLEAAFPQRHMGAWRATLENGQVQFVTDPARAFNGTVNPVTNSCDTTLSVPSDTLLASFQIAWGPPQSTTDLTMAVSAPNGIRQPGGNTVNQPGLTGKRERVLVKSPAAGDWRVQVSNSVNLFGTAQAFTGELEITRIQYGPLGDLGGLSASSQADIYRALRMFVMSAYSGNFYPALSVSRSELAAALVMGGRVPQYIPGQPHYTDVRDTTTMNFVESAQAMPGGPLFPDVSPGMAFGADAPASRLVAAVAMVRAAGLAAQAEAKSYQTGSLTELTDWNAVPDSLRGYVEVAIENGFISVDDSAFHPERPLTRAELAHAMVNITELAY